MTDSRNIMILGAGVFQLPLIEKAKRMNCNTIVVSPIGDYPGISIADVHINLDTTDYNNVLLQAKKHNIEGVVTTGTDVSIPTLAHVTESLNFKGPTVYAAQTVSSKTRFRTFQNQNQLSCPKFKICKSISNVKEFQLEQTKKIVLKPDDSSGSRGVSVIDPGMKPEIIAKAYNLALSYSRNKIVCAEEFIDAKEVGGDAFLIDGKFVFFKTTTKHMRGTVVIGHTVPCDLSPVQINCIEVEILTTCKKLKYANGPLNFDVMIKEEKVIILEMGLRNGGNGITDIMKYCYNFDLIESLINFTIGNPIPKCTAKNNYSVSSYIFGSKKAGILSYITDIEYLKKEVPEVIDIFTAKEIGNAVKPFLHNSNLIGFLVLDTKNCSFMDVSIRLESILQIKVL